MFDVILLSSEGKHPSCICSVLLSHVNSGKRKANMARKGRRKMENSAHSLVCPFTSFYILRKKQMQNLSQSSEISHLSQISSTLFWFPFFICVGNILTLFELYQKLHVHDRAILRTEKKQWANTHYGTSDDVHLGDKGCPSGGYDRVMKSMRIHCEILRQEIAILTDKNANKFHCQLDVT